jgi:hypothetical protein
MLPSPIDRTASPTSNVVHISGTGLNPTERTLPNAAKPAILDPTERNAVTAVGAPSYTSGAHI